MQNYQIYEEIGKGKHSIVYKGRKKKSIDYFAVKSIEKSQRAKVLNEVQILHALSHANVLKFYNWYETNNHLWLIVEYCTGSNLLSIVKGDKCLPEETIHSFCWDIMEGLMYIHTRGILYCDLKPSNLMVDGSGVVKLSDFGLAQLADQLDYGKKGGKKVGTPCYMAPELFQEGGVHSYSSDLWSFGCVFYELATGKPPFVAKEVEKLIQMVLYDTAKPIENFSPEFRDLVDSLVQKDPLQRMDWQELVDHAYWKNKRLKVNPMPPQPYWDQYIREREAQRQLAKKDAEEKRIKEVTRLSANVQSNIKREFASESYQQTGAERGTEGGRLLDHADPDAELDFGDHAAENEGDEEYASEEDGSASPKTNDTHVSGSENFVEENTISISTDHQSIKKQREEERRRHEAPGVPKLTSNEQPPQNMGTTPPAEQLLFHLSDTYVKPIMMNNRIEKIPEPKFNPEELPFPAHPLTTINSLSQKELEGFLTQVYRAIGGHTKIIDKYNSLVYFQTLCTDTQAANLFINSSLMTLFIKMVHNPTHPPNLKVQLCMAMGLLVRHATFINSDLSNSGIIDALVGVLQDPSGKDKKVKRRCAACLGELLFYIATQSAEDKASADGPGAGWDVGDGVICALVECLRGDDEIARHYVTKTIENISGHSDPEYGLKFALPEVLSALIGIYQSGTRNEHLKTAAISAISRLCRIHPAGLSWVLDELGPVQLVKQNGQHNTRANQACINLLNLMLSQCIAYYSAADHFTQPSFLYSQMTILRMRPSTAQQAERGPEENKELVFHICHLGASDISKIENELRTEGGFRVASDLVASLEHASHTLRGKCLLAIFLLAFCGLQFLHLCCEAKLCMILERFSKEKDQYFGHCLQTLLKLLEVVATSSLSTLSLDLESASSSSPVPTQTTENLAIVVHVLTTPSIRAVITTNAIFDWLARCLKAIESHSFPAQDETKRNLFAIVEALSQDGAVVQRHYQALINNLLPALSQLLGSANGDTRFLCLKMFIDILCHYLNDTDFYHPGSTQEPSFGIDSLIVNRLLPQCERLLHDEDPIPLYGLKLMNNVATENPAIVQELYARHLVPKFFEFFELEHRNNNVHNVKLILKVVESPQVPKKLMYDLGIVAKLSSVLGYAFEKNVESFFEPCLDIAHTLLYCTAQAAKQNAASEEYRMHHKSNSPLAKSVLLYVLLSLNRDLSVAETAAHCALLSVQLYSHCHDMFISPPNLNSMRQALLQEGDVVMITKVLLKSLLVILTSHGPERKYASAVQKDELLFLDIQKLSQSAHPDTRGLAGQILTILG
mmetsp:Transcript_73167/g.128920  ORF Transcript_73167/g.128920 Transcript_73167/m.128920 type:complete len:1302 (-) Transcript_73167:67-3972(-)